MEKKFIITMIAIALILTVILCVRLFSAFVENVDRNFNRDTTVQNNYYTDSFGTDAVTDMVITEFDVIEFGGITWLVLYEYNDRKLIISEYLLDFRPYHNELVNITWAHSDIRNWLNSEFYNRFTEEERAYIVETRLMNNSNPWVNTPGGENTRDKIFLLSLEEVVSYFGDSGQMAMPRDRDHEEWWGFNDQYDLNRDARCKERGFYESWWLRSPGSAQTFATIVGPDGMIFVDAPFAVDEDMGIRPALWLSLIPLDGNETEDFEGYADEELIEGDKIELGGITWRILFKRNDRAFVISEYIIEMKRFHNENEEITWANSDMRRWLNDEFYNMFTYDERQRISETEVANNRNPVFGTPGGDNTSDKIFLLSIEEVVRIFGDSNNLRTMIMVNENRFIGQFSDRYDSERIALTLDANYRDWLLRSSGEDNNNVAFITRNGHVNFAGGFVDRRGGVRPVMWIYL